MPQKQILLLQSLAAMPQKLRDLLEDLGEGDPRGSDFLQGGSLHAVLRHLVEYEKRYLRQLRRIVEEDQPRLDEIGSRDADRKGTMKPVELLDQFDTARKKTLSFLTRRTPDDWRQTAIGPREEQTTFHRQIVHLTDYDRSHFNQLKIAQRDPPSGP